MTATQAMSPSLNQRENRESAAEVKFLLPRALGSQLLGWARSHLQPDPHAVESSAYRITSLYFDTAAFDVFLRRGSFGRAKYRVRRYGAEPIVFLERKLKTRGMVSKRRSFIPEADLPTTLGFHPPGTSPATWFASRLHLRRLQPVCQISYLRTALVAMTSQGPIRLTLDDDLRTWPVSEPAFQPHQGGVPFLVDHVILELKYRGHTPKLFRTLAEEFGIAPQPLSKYRLAATALALPPSPSPVTQSPVHPGTH